MIMGRNTKGKSFQFMSFKSLFITALIISLSYCNIWDNIFSQTQASHPISLQESFNFKFELPQEVGLNGNFDFNSELKLITMSFSKNIIIQELQIAKGQLDLNTLVINVNQFLLGCQRFKLGIPQDINGKVTSGINSVTFSKSSLFLINLLFKYIGKYQLKDNQKSGNKNPEQNLIDMIKNGIFGGESKSLSDLFGQKKKIYNMFQFSIDLYKDPTKLIQNIKDGKQKAQNMLNIDEIEDFDISQLDWSKFKFVILADSITGQIKKAYKSRQMTEQLQFDLHSKQKKATECKSQIKTLTMKQITDGAKFLYQNKGDLQNVFNN